MAVSDPPSRPPSSVATGKSSPVAGGDVEGDMLGGSTTIDDSSEFAFGSSDVVDASVSLEGDVERTPPRHERGPSIVHDIVTTAIDKAEESAEAWEAVDAAMERATEDISKSASMDGSRPPTAASQGTQVHNLVEDAIHNVEAESEQNTMIHDLVEASSNTSSTPPGRIQTPNHHPSYRTTSAPRRTRRSSTRATSTAPISRVRTRRTRAPGISRGRSCRAASCRPCRTWKQPAT